jgi:hypothetical protein
MVNSASVTGVANAGLQAARSTPAAGNTTAARRVSAASSPRPAAAATQRRGAPRVTQRAGARSARAACGAWRELGAALPCCAVRLATGCGACAVLAANAMVNSAWRGDEVSC